jgi:hypothetical protein
MSSRIPAVCAAVAALFGAVPGQASAPVGLRPADALPVKFVQFFFEWKSEPKGLRVSDLKVYAAGGSLRVLCGAYDLPGQSRRPFLVMGDDTPSASAAWEPGSFPESDPLYPQLMNNLRLCQTQGAAVATG